MSCIFRCSTKVEAVSPQQSAPKASRTSYNVAQAHQIILNSIPGSVNERTSSPLFDRPVVLLSPPKATLGFRPIPSEEEIIHTELPPISSTKTTPDEELEHHYSGEESPWSASSESPHDTPDATARNTPRKGVKLGFTGSTPSDGALTPVNGPEEIDPVDEIPGELIIRQKESPPPKPYSRNVLIHPRLPINPRLCVSPSPEPDQLPVSTQTTTASTISLKREAD